MSKGDVTESRYGQNYFLSFFFMSARTDKIYTTWAHILSDRNAFFTPRGGEKTTGSNAPGDFLVQFITYHFPFIWEVLLLFQVSLSVTCSKKNIYIF